MKLFKPPHTLLTLMGKKESGYSAEAQQFFSRLPTLPSEEILIAIDDFIKGLMDDGIYQKIDEMWLFALDTSDNSLIGIKGVANCSIVGTVHHTTKRGFISDGGTTDYLNTNFSPANNKVSLALNSNHIGIYSRTDTAKSASDMGVVDSSPNGDFWIQARDSGDRGNFKNCAKNNGQWAVSPTSLGFFVSVRSVSNLTTLYRDGVSRATSVFASTAVPDNNIYICRHYASFGVPTTDREYAFATVGGVLTATDVLNYKNHLETLLDILGAGVLP